MMTQLPEFVFINDLGIEYSIVNNIIRSDMDSGIPKLKQINSVPLFNLRFEVSIEYKNINSFYSWFNNDLRSGAFWFIMIHPLTGEKTKVRFMEYDFSWRKIGTLMVSNFSLEGYHV